MVDSLGGEVERTRMVKCLFLLKETKASKLPKNAVYDFVPYKYGPFSFTLYHEVGALVRDGFLTEAGDRISIAPAGAKEAKETETGAWHACTSIVKEFGGLELDELVARVYAEHPWFTVNAESKEKRLAEPLSAEKKVYTIGYESHTLDGLLNLLLRNGIERLVDVRANPVARRYGFHRSTLAKACPNVGLEYVHVPEVGVPSDWRSDLQSQADYDALFERYEREIVPAQAAAVQRLAGMMREKPSAMMCREAEPECCHRTTLARAVSKIASLPVAEVGAAAAEESQGELFAC